VPPTSWLFFLFSLVALFSCFSIILLLLATGRFFSWLIAVSPWFFLFFLVVAFSYGAFYQSAELPPVPVLLKQTVHDLMAYHQRR
jgi:hypothetical protein